MPVLSSELTLTSITTSPQMCWLTTRVRPLTCHRHDARDIHESVPCTCDEGMGRAHVCTLTISSVPNHVAVHVDNRDLQKANGKLGVTAWRCETLCDSPAGVDVRAGRKRGTFCSHAAGLRMRQQLR